MNPRECLIDFLIGGNAVAAAALARIECEDARPEEARPEEAWSAIFDLAAVWSVLPNLRTRLTELGNPLSVALRQRLFVRFQEVYASSTLQARRGVAVCAALEDHGIPAVIFKGLASIAHLYQGNPSARTIKDVDILILEKDLAAALRVMESLGLKPEHGGDLAGYAAFVRNSPGFAGNQAIAVSGAGDLDVHWSIGPNPAAEFRVDAILERSGWVNLFERQVRVIAPADGLLLSAHHAIRENFAPDGMLRDVLDASGWLKLLEHRGELDLCLGRARRCRIEDAVLALAAILEARGTAAPTAADVSTNAAALAQLFQLQAAEGPLGKDLAYLADAHSLRQIFRGVLSGWGEYSARMKAFETKLTGKPVSLPHRLAHLTRQMPRYGFRGWKMIRVLAKTKAAYQRGA